MGAKAETNDPDKEKDEFVEKGERGGEFLHGRIFICVRFSFLPR